MARNDAKDALAEAVRQSAAQERMADAMEWRAQPEEGDGIIDLSRTAIDAPIKFVIEPTVPKGYWLLRNEGTEVAHGIKIPEPAGVIARHLPQGDIDLSPFHSIQFLLLAAGWGSHLPGELEIQTSNRSEPWIVPLPQ
jgi:hypothetical protein